MSLPHLSEIDVLLLDMDGTLLDLHFDDFFWNHYLHRRFAEINDISVESARSHVSVTLSGEEGTLNWYCTDYWSQTFGVDILALKRELTHLIQYRTGARQFLEHVRSLPIEVILVTNAHPDVVSLKHAHTGLLDLIEVKVTSHEYGAPKESALFWDRFAQGHDIMAGAALLIDDSLPVLRAAREFGIEHQLAVSRPSSEKPERDVADFTTINELTELTEDSGSSTA